jgi:hypothetical protein
VGACVCVFPRVRRCVALLCSDSKGADKGGATMGTTAPAAKEGSTGTLLSCAAGLHVP